MKIALAHDDFMQWGGAERVVTQWAKVFPEAPIFTIAVSEDVRSKTGLSRDRFKTTWIDHLPFKQRLNRVLFPFYPVAFEAFQFNEYDVVLSSSARFAHGLITPPETVHIAYIHSPFRGFWEPRMYFGDSAMGVFQRRLLSPLLVKMRQWDYIAGQRPNHLVGNSKTISKRIAKYWRRDSDSIYPFVDIERFSQSQPPHIGLPDKYFVVVSRLVEWKRIDIVVEAFNELGIPLLVIGSGSYKSELERLAKDNILFPGFVSDAELTHIVSNAEALIHPQREDFGMTVVEANACGTPVIAYAAGGATETVVEGMNGMFFYEQTSQSLREAVKKFNPEMYNNEHMRDHASTFSIDAFSQAWKDYVERTLQSAETKTMD